MTRPDDARRRLPQVDRLVAQLEGDAAGLPRAVVVDAVRTVVDAARRRARRTKQVPPADELQASCADELRRRRANLLRPVINATGVVLHTNLGRAPLSPAAIDAVVAVARGYSNLEFDTDHGRRGDRYVHVEPLLALLCGTEAALVVNNNAAAVLLVCSALAKDREVVISRGELIEIGGEFRIPDILESSGARLREVGTTNRTHLRDYERAIGERTAFVLKVHPSNYRVVGFTTSPEVEELAKVAHGKGVPLVYDVGSGLVARPFADEPVVGDVVAAGADLVCFSGDKLFGGPQAGVVAGTADLIAPLRSNPMLRALRPDKMQLAALTATVTQYLADKSDEVPVWRMVDADVTVRATKLARALTKLGYEAEIVPGESVAGGGSLPGHAMPTTLVRVGSTGTSAKDLAAALRTGEVPVVVRVEHGSVFVDLRTVLPEQDARLLAALSGAAAYRT
jgi:L-seryl-tRNA(Ser) seleniumtransferase